VKSRIAWVSGALGGATLIAALARRRRILSAPTPAAVDTRAGDLRRKLAESRAVVAERDEFESGETSVDRAEPVGGDPDARRRRVHEQGRAALDRMRSARPGE
jgi:hypothetical protein